MFTIKLYSDNGFRQIIQEADSFTILRMEQGETEITMHRRVGEDSRVDIKDPHPPNCGVPADCPPRFQKAIIENSAGKTTEVVWLRLLPAAKSAA